MLFPSEATNIATTSSPSSSSSSSSKMEEEEEEEEASFRLAWLSIVENWIWCCPLALDPLLLLLLLLKVGQALKHFGAGSTVAGARKEPSPSRVDYGRQQEQPELAVQVPYNFAFFFFKFCYLQ
jgi:hypothetical protein